MTETTLSRNQSRKSVKLSYSTKLIFYSVLGIHLPLVGFISFVKLSSLAIEPSAIISLLLFLTVGATLITVPIINRILNPLKASSKVLEDYYGEDILPKPAQYNAERSHTYLTRLQRTVISLHGHIQEKKDLSRLLSQDLRQPFAQMMGIFEIIKLEEDHLKINAYCNQMIAEGKKQLGFLEYVLDELNTSHTEESTIERSYITVNELINNAVESSNTTARNKNVSFMIASRCNPVLELEEMESTEALTKVLANSIKYSFPKGVVKIQTAMEKNFVEITVSDSGMGFEKEERKTLFKRFVRAQTGTQGEDSTKHSLYTAKETIEKQGGTIELSSDGRGTGSSFKIILPLTY
ncbi:HAMP domain-containing histidine kinase [Cryomorpha ignava]|uniref:histidine kinase n=1 Tax=Cryomorpha ignava TaxID=101383 RepID=A0A7K3WRX8_9FLAO|nr:HAMP domain-containing sensor histidine kinase [Cryomorpha ignava]NEN24423.1 HAMP domain-containing histidine kinase [Cryomorpha ignava]